MFIYGIVFFPLFCSLAIGSVFGYVVGASYAWMLLIIDIYKLAGCNENGIDTVCYYVKNINISISIIWNEETKLTVVQSPITCHFIALARVVAFSSNCFRSSSFVALKSSHIVQSFFFFFFFFWFMPWEPMLWILFENKG